MSQSQILIVEDEPVVARSLQAGLSREGFAVTWKSTGGEGVEYARQASPHLVLLDIRLPDGSGFDFCRQMRQMGLRQPVIMLTARYDEMDKVLGLEMGADDYVTKPFGLRELVSRIRAQLRRAYGDYAVAESATLVVADLVLDLASGQVRRGEQVIVLTPIEFRLLSYLARHRGQALTRQQIVEDVWGFAPDLESEKSIKVHIRHLREKIENDPSHPELLLTVPGVGYRLAGEVMKP
ncbi:MAG TPA: response regulator transcription factor [Anaerolineales bacterium]|nr:response regulator transcription factor [Anaerolineales bacterium]